MSTLSVAVLIPSWRRPDQLRQCLLGLAAQTRLPDRVVVVWQGNDEPTRDAVEALRGELPFRLDVLHNPETGIVPAENFALDHTTEDVIALIDDDAVAPADWLARHLAFYADPRVGAVGGPADDFFADGSPFPRHPVEPIGTITWIGRAVGNMYDHPIEWRTRPPIEVSHLVGYNMTLRRSAFDRFEMGLRRYWQGFELEVCLQVQKRGFRVMFDFGNVVRHYPTNTVYVPGRGGDLTTIYNGAYNRGYIAGKHLPYLRWPFLFFWQTLIGEVSTPGIAASLVACKRHGAPLREMGILLRTSWAFVNGWWAGWRRRMSEHRVKTENTVSQPVADGSGS